MIKTFVLLPMLLEWVGLGGLIALLAYIPWSKMALGAVLTLAGAFYPHSSADKARGEGHVKSANFAAFFKGSLRAGVTIAGIILVVGSVLDGYTAKAKHEDSNEMFSLRQEAEQQSKADENNVRHDPVEKRTK